MVVQPNMMTAVAGGLGLAFVGYCVYFDHKRRSQPDFKRKLIEKRRSQKEARKNDSNTQYPDLTDEVAVQTFFMKEIALGEQLLGLGDIENGIEHLANAVAVTPHKENLLNVLKTSLPDPVFKLLVQTIPIVTQKIFASYKMRASAEPGYEEGAKITEIVEEDEPISQDVHIDDCLD